MGTVQDDDEDFKWRPPKGDGVLGKEEYQADDNEVFRVDDGAPLAPPSYPGAGHALPSQSRCGLTGSWLLATQYDSDSALQC